MRSIFLFLFLNLVFASCIKTIPPIAPPNQDANPTDDKTVITSEVKLVRDCTGTYIRYQEKDYQVCNFELLNDVASDNNITAEFYQSDDCDNPAFKDMIVCAMYHENEGWIKIKSFK